MFDFICQPNLLDNLYTIELNIPLTHTGLQRILYDPTCPTFVYASPLLKFQRKFNDNKYKNIENDYAKNNYSQRAGKAS